MNIQEILTEISGLTVRELVHLADVLDVPVTNLAKGAVTAVSGMLYFRPDPTRDETRQKIQFIKGIREVTGLPLKEAKEVSEGSYGLSVKSYDHDDLRRVKDYAKEFGYIPEHRKE